VERTTQVKVEQPNDYSDGDSCWAEFDLAICPATHARDYESEQLSDKVSDETEALNLWIGTIYQSA
jgi:hypothetical protein